MTWTEMLEKAQDGVLLRGRSTTTSCHKLNLSCSRTHSLTDVFFPTFKLVS